MKTKNWDDVNETKIEAIVDTLDAFDRRIFLCAKKTGSRLTVRGTMISGTVLLATYYFILCVHIAMLPHLASKINSMVALCTFPYITDLAAET